MPEIKLVTTSLSDDSYCRCENCGKVIAELKDDKMLPSFDECYNFGNIPVPNLGWFCSQDCALEFEKKHDLTFMRTGEGKIDYYLDN